MASRQAESKSPLELSSSLTSTKQNTLILDVFLVSIRPPPQNASTSSKDDQNDNIPQQQQQLFVALADLAVTLNARFAATRYPWFSGGDGIVFGLHCSPANDHFDSENSHVGNVAQDRSSLMIPHLRAVCRYGVSVADEWQAIQLLLSQRFDRETTVDDGIITTTTLHKYQMVTECWDVDDGQVLLIEASEHLPRWVDDIGPDQCRHRCWIVSHDTFSECEIRGLALTPQCKMLRGGICLIAPTNNSDWNSPPPLSLQMALQTLQAHFGHWDSQFGQSVQVASEPVHQAIHATFHRHLARSIFLLQTAAAAAAAINHCQQVRWCIAQPWRYPELSLA
jgi:hypothetical protein